MPGLRSRLQLYLENQTPIIVNGIADTEHCRCTVKSIDPPGTDDCVVLSLVQNGRKVEDLKEEELIVAINRIFFISEGQKPYSGPVKNTLQGLTPEVPEDTQGEGERGEEEDVGGEGEEEEDVEND